MFNCWIGWRQTCLKCVYYGCVDSTRALIPIYLKIGVFLYSLSVQHWQRCNSGFIVMAAARSEQRTTRVSIENLSALSPLSSLFIPPLRSPLFSWRPRLATRIPSLEFLGSFSLPSLPPMIYLFLHPLPPQRRSCSARGWRRLERACAASSWLFSSSFPFIIFFFPFEFFSSYSFLYYS